MSLDPLPPLEAHRRERDVYRNEDELEWRQREDCESEAATAAYWQRVMDRQTAERPAEHWPTGPDRRFFAVDGELAGDARRDREHHDIPGWVA